MSTASTIWMNPSRDLRTAFLSMMQIGIGVKYQDETGKVNTVWNSMLNPEKIPSRKSIVWIPPQEEIEAEARRIHRRLEVGTISQVASILLLRPYLPKGEVNISIPGIYDPGFGALIIGDSVLFYNKNNN